MAIAFETVATNTGTDTSAEVTLPSGLTTGDLMIATVHNRTSTDAPGTHTWPGGWNVVHNVQCALGASTIGGTISVAWRAWVSGDSAPTVTGVDATQGCWVSICTRYSGADLTTPFADEDGVEEARNPSTSADLVVPTLTGGTADWVVATYSGAQLAARTWGSYAVATSERADLTHSPAQTIEVPTAWADSNGTVNTSGGVAPSGDPSGTITTAAAWGGILVARPDAVNAPGGTTTQTGTSNQPVSAVKTNVTEYTRLG